MFPLHIWLPKAHPVAPAPASALLSGILTKSGIFGVIVVSANIFRASTAWGNMLLVLGLITMLGGAVLAVFSINLKRTLACSSMSQIGFILTGIAMGCLLGEENALAARGALIRRCGNYPGLDETWYRTAVRTQKENEQLLKIMREVLA